ncbi:MAG: cyclodeaminase [SAR324 cluster bacterium]|nr:cyclodeaminase [SAR324 cluster bacterium]
MPTIKILTETELRKIVKLDLDAVDCIESAFRKLAEGSVVMPPILSMAIEEHHGEVDVKTAYVPGIENFAIKISPGFFNNPKIGLPSTSGLMVLFSVRTGMLEALLLDNGYLTDVRTAAAGAVAANHLSRKESESACIVGAGNQARLQLQALCLVRPIQKATVWSPEEDEAKETAKELTERLGIPVRASLDIAAIVSEADIVVTTTPSTNPLVYAEWLRPGQHITSMGSDQPNKNELEPACLKRADIYIADRISQTSVLGELHHAILSGTIEATEEFPELGEIVAKKKQGRINSEQITICDLTGTGVQDTAIATFAKQRAEIDGTGNNFVN